MYKRIILHIDMNSYFASVEQQANPFLRNKPIGVSGKQSERSVVVAASIEAKKQGVKTAMSTWEAKQICPSIILVAGDPEKYSNITSRFNQIFSEFTDRVERFSVDESFLDITDTAKDNMGAIIMAKMIKCRLREECGERITASIGIGPNKLMAKLASERVKPNGLTVVKPGEEISLLDQADLEDVCGIGPRIRQRLENLGILNFKNLREYPLGRLVEEFKSYGYWLYEAAHGRDLSSLVVDDDEPKSVGHSYTLPHDTEDPVEMKRYLLVLCDRVAWRLRRDGFQAGCVSAYVRHGDPSTQANDGLCSGLRPNGLRFTTNCKQYRFHDATNDGLKLFKIAWQLIDSIRDPMKPVRLIGISASLLSSGATQRPLFKKEQKMLSVLPALDKIQSRYGADSWTRASLLPIQIKARSSGFHYDHEV